MYIGASLIAQSVKNLPAMQETQVQFRVGQEEPLERKWQSTPAFLLGESHGQRSLAGYPCGFAFPCELGPRGLPQLRENSL